MLKLSYLLWLCTVKVLWPLYYLLVMIIIDLLESTAGYRSLLQHGIELSRLFEYSQYLTVFKEPTIRGTTGNWSKIPSGVEARISLTFVMFVFELHSRTHPWSAIKLSLQLSVTLCLPFHYEFFVLAIGIFFLRLA